MAEAAALPAIPSSGTPPRRTAPSAAASPSTPSIRTYQGFQLRPGSVPRLRTPVGRAGSSPAVSRPQSVPRPLHTPVRRMRASPAFATPGSPRTSSPLGRSASAVRRSASPMKRSASPLRLTATFAPHAPWTCERSAAGNEVGGLGLSGDMEEEIRSMEEATKELRRAVSLGARPKAGRGAAEGRYVWAQSRKCLRESQPALPAPACLSGPAFSYPTRLGAHSGSTLVTTAGRRRHERARPRHRRAAPAPGSHQRLPRP